MTGIARRLWCWLRRRHRWQVVETGYDLGTRWQRREVWRYCKTCGLQNR